MVFKTRQGLYQWLVIPFGLCNALATFMILMNDMLCPLIDSFGIVYLDDILIFSNTWKHKLSHVMELLYTLKKYQLNTKLKECHEFEEDSLVYLRHMIGASEMRVGLDKNRTIN